MHAGGQLRFAGSDLSRLSTRRGWFSAALLVKGLTQPALKGLPKREQPFLDAALGRLRARHDALPAVQAAVAWYQQVKQVTSAAKQDRRWLTEETLQQLQHARPGAAVSRTLAAGAVYLYPVLSGTERKACTFLDIDLHEQFALLNEEFFQAEKQHEKAFFAAIEGQPLTDEQTRAVVCFDNRVQVIASAGSGKTSVMVARTAYAIKRGLVPADRILLLAFNNAAAKELQQRVEARLAAVGLPTEGVRANTFHAFGLSTIAAATGRKPRPAPWLEGGQDIETMCHIVDELRDGSRRFAYRWDLFRLLYARADESITGGDPDGWIQSTRSSGYRTANGEVVRSHGERLIADWLFFSGVSYRYEHPYVIDVADREHSQYRPDFYYPTVDAWHEHWALGADGQPPKEFEGYAASMEWKCQLHATHGTRLIETTWAGIMAPRGLDELAKTLADLGVELDWNPDRNSPGVKPLKHEDLARLVRSFMSHVKSNSLTRDNLEQRVTDHTPPAAQPRSRLFLELYFAIAERWDEKLREDDFVDFEDMLVQAADHLETGRAKSHYDLVMVDEFQDASRARARLTRALVQEPGKYVLAVGDDWQSINRFAGADIAVMTGFNEWFGPGPTLRLQTTFRCPQTLADTASAFVAKNPRQLSKVILSAQSAPGAHVRLIRAATAETITAELRAEFARIADVVATEQPTSPNRGPVTVDVLGRYNFDRQLMPAVEFPGLRIQFRTAHSSKGLEADFVILPNVTTGNYGFPSTIQDDPVLSLAMADPDEFPHAEERRLFYVALTRARRQMTIVTVKGRESPFVIELLKDRRLEMDGAEDEDELPQLCPRCGVGVLVQRKGPYGVFFACSTWPRCGCTMKQLPVVQVSDSMLSQEPDWNSPHGTSHR